MKHWQSALLGLLVGCVLIAAIFIIARQPHGTSITLKPAPTQSPIMVHVTGCVLTPGLYLLPPKSRVNDAILAAGGLSDCSDSTAVNLASVLKDGQRVLIPPNNQTPTINEELDQTKSIQIPLDNAPLDINQATVDELQALPGIGPTKAQSIVDYRDEHGPYLELTDLLNVSGIGEKTLEQISNLIIIN